MKHLSSRIPCAIVALLVVGWLMPRTGEASEEARLDRGHTIYQTYCGVCHGPTGKGDGPFGPELRAVPTDLTTIAARRNGVFPGAQIAEVIDGRRVTRGHGPRDMPVWGKKFGIDVAAGSADRAVARDQILAIVDYLRAIQITPEATEDGGDEK